jgi:signal transduction histidine kinase
LSTPVELSAAAPSRVLPRLRALSAVLLVVVAAIAVAGFLVTRHVVSDQGHKLLKQRADEAGLYLSSVIGSVQTELASLASTAAATKESVTAFRSSTRLLTSLPSGFKGIALVRIATTPTIVASSGKGLGDGLGTVRSDAIMQAAAKAGLTGGLVGTPLFAGADGSRLLGFAYATPALPGFAIYAESQLQPTTSASTTSSQPFSELIAAVYAVPRVQADQLVAATGGSTRLPLRGDVASTQAPIGVGQPWLLVAKARHPLVGSVATATPWALLGAGLLAALLATAVVETLARRREYAFGVADQRTAELKASLTDLAAAHDQLVRSERLAAIGQLASTIGHELRNPLGVISNAVYLLRGDLGPAPTDAAERHLATAEREVSAATVIVSDLLEFARQRDPVLTEIDVAALVDEVVSVLPPPTNISLSRELPADTLLVFADRDMLRQVVLNLLGNAYQAMPDGGRARVSVGVDNGSVLVSIADSGVGMTDDVRERLYEPFFTTKARGVGLGLAVTKRIVDAHRGDITVESQPDIGTTFVVRLPRLTLPHQATRPVDDETSAEARR